MEFKGQIGLQFGGAKKRMGEGDEKRKRKKKRRRKMRDQVQKGMELWIFGMETTLIMELNGSMETLRLCMINIMSPNLGFSLNCILTLDFLKLRWVKPTRNKISKEFPF